MNLDQSNHFSMYKKTRDLLDAEDVLVSKIPAFKRAADQLKKNIELISDIDSGKVTLTEGKADDKAQKKLQLARAVYLISSSIFTYADEGNLTDLKKSSEYSESELSHLSEPQLLTTSKALIKLVEGKEAALEDHGFRAEYVSDATAKLAAYENSISAAGTDTQKSISATKNLAAVFTETNTLLKNRCDHYADKYKEESPDFCNRYTAARRIIDLSASHKTEEPAPAVNQNTAQPS